MITREPNSKQELLSYDEFTFVVGIVIESTDIEITRVASSKNVEIIVSYLLSLFLSTDYFSFFTLVNVQHTTMDIFDNIVIRDFILNVTDRISLSLPLSEEEENKLIKTVVRGICRNKVNDDNSLIIKEVSDSLHINPEVLTSCFKSNFWLIVVYINSMYFHKTQIYHTFKEKESGK